MSIEINNLSLGYQDKLVTERRKNHLNGTKM